jgi:5-methylthioadenosine/S-adenosylhomocysteine deaminase
MSRILIENVEVLTLEGEDPPVRASIAIEGERVLAIGEPPPGFEPDERVDGREQLALPGFFNAHCHSPMTLVRGWAEDLPFERWLNERIWVAESALCEEDVYWGAALAACEMIRGGVVGFADHYFWMDQVARVVEESGLRALLAWCHFGLGPDREVGGASWERTLEFVRGWGGAAGGRIRTAIGPHSPYMCPPPTLRAAADAAADLGVPIHLHLAESAEQVARSRERHGVTPVAQLEQLGVLDVPCLAAHCLCLDDADLEILARHPVTVAHTPKTYQKLAMAPAPLPRLVAAGIPVALGSDGPASNSDLNLLEVMRLTGLQQKQSLGDAAAFPRSFLLRCATRTGAAAMGFAGSGRLLPGAPADLILVDTRAPHWRPRHDLMAGLVYTAHPSDVSHVMVAGRWLLRKGALCTLDEERILAEAERRAARIVGSEMSSLRRYSG